MKRTVLIDADILAYQVASTNQKEYTFGGNTVIDADEEKALKEVDKAIASIVRKTSATRAVLFLTGDTNFRKEVLPTYKAQRNPAAKPVLLKPIKEYMKNSGFPCVYEDRLEADDLIGIHLTMPHDGLRFVYSIDKDLRTVPGWHWDEEDGEVIEVSHYDADSFFFEQILTGDAVDNYKGCPGVGKVAAKEMIENPYTWVKTVRPYKRGPRKGQDKVDWIKKPYGEVHNYADIWECIVSFYHKAGLTEEDALIQARCARILRHGEYNFKTKEVKLWTSVN